MWSNLTKRLADIAEDITTPQYEADHDPNVPTRPRHSPRVITSQVPHPTASVVRSLSRDLSSEAAVHEGDDGVVTPPHPVRGPPPAPVQHTASVTNTQPNVHRATQTDFHDEDDARRLTELETLRTLLRQLELDKQTESQRQRADYAELQTQHRRALDELAQSSLDAVRAAVRETERRVRDEVASASPNTTHDDAPDVTAKQESVLDELRERLTNVEAERDAQARRVRELEDAHAANTAASATLRDQLAAVQRQLTETRAELLAARSHHDDAATRERDALAERLSHYEELIHQLQRTITECLLRAEVPLPTRGDDDDAVDGPGRELTFSDLVVLLTSEFAKQHTVLRKAERVQHEWESTYAQARGVNQTLQQQISDAWRTIGTLREESSLKDEVVEKLQAQIQQDTEAQTATQGRLVAAVTELKALQEEREGWVVRLEEAVQSATAQHDALAIAQHENAQLKAALQDRDDELATAQRSLENVQQVLHTFKARRKEAIEESTLDLQAEIDELKGQLARTVPLREEYEAKLEQQRAAHTKELASRQLELTALHRKLAELRRALEVSARQLSGETMIDKTVVSHLLVSYIQAFIEQRREADEVLKVMSGLLSWDETMQERAGLLPGPLNPRSGSHTGRGNERRGLLRWMRRQQPPPTSAPTRASLATLWVEFLIRESERGDVAAHDLASPETTAAEASASLSASDAAAATKATEGD